LHLCLCALGACTEQPHAGDAYQAPPFQHATLTSGQACGSCHEGGSPGRPGPAADGTAHGGGQDCGVCHIAADSPDLSQWSNRQPFNHVPKPAACEPCHATERPTAATDAAHPAAGDCAGCHDYPVFKAPGT
jgi:hypothetical protein